jgi:superfamily II DNA or RNA helicase
LKVVVDGRAWLLKKDLTREQLESLRNTLTVVPSSSSEQEDDPVPLPLYVEDKDRIGIPRQYFMERRRDRHDVVMNVTEGDTARWAGPIKFSGKLRPEQQEALDVVVPKLKAGLLGGIIRASPGWGKTVACCALIEALEVPTLVVVHKEFLMDQWEARIEEFLPGVKVGKVQQNMCDYTGKNVVLGMVHSLAIEGKYPESFYNWPGLVITDEVHRIGAKTWSPVPAMFPARYRVGVSATPRRKDGADNVFYYNLGRILFSAKEQRMVPRVRRVWSNFRFTKTDRFNPNVISRSILINILCKSRARNRLITSQAVLAARAGRKILVLSERLEHLATLEKMLLEEMPDDAPTTGYYVGGMTKDEREESSKKQIIFATAQFASEGMDIPPLDTLFITTPLSDVEQGVGRILRPYEGKKEPVVVDFRDEKVAKFSNSGKSRDKYYKRIGVVD